MHNFKKENFFSTLVCQRQTLNKRCLFWVYFPTNKEKKQTQRCFYTKRIAAKERIGPHQQQVISTLVGNLLGDGYMEKRKNATRMHIHMSSRNVEYINWLHLFFSEKGYCSVTKPKLSKQIGKGNKIYFSCKFRTFSFSSFTFLHDSFYVKTKKRVPKNIYNLLSPRALAIWIMNDGRKSGAGIKISTESFCLQDVILLQTVIFEKFKITCIVQRHKSNYVIYFPKNQLSCVSEIAKPYMIPCMYYKLNMY